MQVHPLRQILHETFHNANFSRPLPIDASYMRKRRHGQNATTEVIRMSIELNSDSMFASPRREGEGSTYVGWRNPELAEGCGRGCSNLLLVYIDQVGLLWICPPTAFPSTLRARSHPSRRPLETAMPALPPRLLYFSRAVGKQQGGTRNRRRTLLINLNFGGYARQAGRCEMPTAQPPFNKTKDDLSMQV